MVPYILSTSTCPVHARFNFHTPFLFIITYYYCLLSLGNTTRRRIRENKTFRGAIHGSFPLVSYKTLIMQSWCHLPILTQHQGLLARPDFISSQGKVLILNYKGDTVKIRCDPLNNIFCLLQIKRDDHCLCVESFVNCRYKIKCQFPINHM